MVIYANRYRLRKQYEGQGLKGAAYGQSHLLKPQIRHHGVQVEFQPVHYPWLLYLSSLGAQSCTRLIKHPQ